MKIKKTELRQMIKEILIEIQSDQELDNAIRQYMKLSEECRKKEAELKPILDELEKSKKEAQKMAKDIEKYMTTFNITLRKVDKWVFKIVEVAKYKVIRPDYKELWETLLTKVNAAIQNVMKRLLEAQLEAKRKETVKQLSIEEGFIDTIKKLWVKFSLWFRAVTDFQRIVDKLPDIKTQSFVSGSKYSGFDD